MMNNSNFKFGQKVRVLRSNGDTWKEIHSGVIVGSTSHFVKVYKYRKRPDDTSADVCPETSEWFAVKSKSVKVV